MPAPTTTVFNLQRDVTGAPAYAPTFSNNLWNTQLSQGVEQTLTVPADNNFYEVVFSIQTGTNVWIGVGSVAVNLPSTSFAATSGEQNPSVRRVPAGATLRFMTSDTTSNVGVAFYASN
jgi:hypothetical protein